MIGDSLRDRIEVQLRTRTRSATGHTDGAWTPDVEVWGLVIPVGVSNLARFGQLHHAETTHLIVVRDRQTWEVDKTQFVFGSDTFQPLGPPMYLGQVQNMTTIEVKAV